MNAQRGIRYIAHSFFNLGTIRGCVVNAMPWPLFPQGRDLVSTVQHPGCAPGPVWTGAENLTPHQDSTH